MKTGELQKAVEDFATDAFDAIHKLKQALRERDERIAELERDNKALRLVIEQERETAEW